MFYFYFQMSNSIFANGTNPTKANWAKAALILILVWIILGIIFGGYFMRMFYGNYPTSLVSR